ncbi:hypothetical protein CLV56_0299 [Mumia flava]|uniref:Mce-associated membrane protein n=1 Tax=Mumia flava TaxID=1348852 RepID=A0A0B2B2R8_9ACTN|nr:hypothetical protein [Mumia flava]PJJ56095.1 hypothetical protein CLV56_0299 [Mumia flava]
MTLIAWLLAVLGILQTADAAPWPERLAELDAARGRAFVQADASLLDRVYVAGSTERRADARLLRRYRDRDLELDQVRLEVRSVVVERRGDRTTVLRVVDRLAPVRVRSPGGRWTTLPADAPTERRVALRRTARGWRIAAIERLAG